MPMTNEERAEHAGNAITEYVASKGEPHDGPATEYEISDLICDLLHHGNRCGFCHQDLLDRALMHYSAEKAEDGLDRRPEREGSMTTDPFTLTAAAAINQLVALLAEARTYLDQGEALAAIGTLVMFDDHAEDVRAAIRTLQMAQRRRR
jgi:hypothetical protein